MQKIVFSILILLSSMAGCAQSASRMDFEKYDPPSTLVVTEHKLTRAKYPFIDVHNHQINMTSQNIKALVQDRDKLNLQIMVNLSGQAAKQ